MQTPPASNRTPDQPPTARRKRGVFFWVSRMVLGFAIALIALGISGAIYQAIGTAMDQRNYPPPGQLVDVGGYQMHLYCTGEGSPTVILDSLFPGTVSDWAWVQPEIAKTTRVCAYDRAGSGWSESGPEPRDAKQQARELHTLLTNAGIDGPFVLVGHSLGGLYSRLFADQYPNEVVGMALIEGTNPDTWRRLGKPEGVGVDRNQLAVAPFLARLGIFRLGLIPFYSSNPDLPPQQRKQLQAFFDSAKSLETIRAVDASFSVALDQVRSAGGLGSKPLAIVLGSQGDGGIEQLRELFNQQAALSTNSLTLVIDGATHAGLVENQNYAPQTSAAILKVVEAARTGQSIEASQR